MLGETDTDAIVRAVEHLGERIDRAIESIRAEVRNIRNSLVVVLLVAFLILGGALGVGMVYGDARVNPVSLPASTVVTDGP